VPNVPVTAALLSTTSPLPGLISSLLSDVAGVTEITTGWFVTDSPKRSDISLGFVWTEPALCGVCAPGAEILVGWTGATGPLGFTVRFGLTGATGALFAEFVVKCEWSGTGKATAGTMAVATRMNTTESLN